MWTPEPRRLQKGHMRSLVSMQWGDCKIAWRGPLGPGSAGSNILPTTTHAEQWRPPSSRTSSPAPSVGPNLTWRIFSLEIRITDHLSKGALGGERQYIDN